MWRKLPFAHQEAKAQEPDSRDSLVQRFVGRAHTHPPPAAAHSSRAPTPLLVAQTLRGGCATGARGPGRGGSLRMCAAGTAGAASGRHRAWPQASHSRGACFQGAAHRRLAESRCRGSAVFVTYPSCSRGSVSISAPLPGGPTLRTQWAGPWRVVDKPLPVFWEQNPPGF